MIDLRFRLVTENTRHGHPVSLFVSTPYATTTLASLSAQLKRRAYSSQNSAEAAVLEPRYKLLFTDAEREIARRCLELHGFDVECFFETI